MVTATQLKSIKKTRADVVDEITSHPVYDLVIIGGGIHGATAAKIAASNGISTLLLEQNDYASGTSSRSSKMAHGGLRYLEMFDFKQVFEGVKAREKLIRDYPEHVTAYPFYIPVYKNHPWFKFKLGVGLKLYDLMLKNSKRKHSWIPADKVKEQIPELQDHDLAGCFCYYDGIMDDARLVILNIMEARLKGAECLNYAKVIEVKDSNVKWQDTITNEIYETAFQAALNCAGPWVQDFTIKKKTKIKYSRGSHIIFSKPWNAPALFLPMEGKARYYFVWPHPGGTMVGTTEREINVIEDDPLPSKDEIDEILERLEKDLPNSNLTRENAHYAFAGIRTLPLRDHTKNTSRISRRHIWQKDSNVFSLLGGKYTTAEWTVIEGLELAFKVLQRKLASSKKAFKIDYKEDFDFAENYTQIEYLEDYTRRRTNLEYMANFNLDDINDSRFIKQKNQLLEKRQKILELLT